MQPWKYKRKLKNQKQFKAAKRAMITAKEIHDFTMKNAKTVLSSTKSFTRKTAGAGAVCMRLRESFENYNLRFLELLNENTEFGMNDPKYKDDVAIVVA